MNSEFFLILGKFRLSIGKSKANKMAHKKDIKFIKSAVYPKDYPIHKFRELLICGRSNAGKSSIINTLGHSQVAKVSQTPGKTSLLNFFQVGKSYVMVDSPGYGFASRSSAEIEQWQEMMSTYIKEREIIAAVLLLMDCKRDWQEEEEEFAALCHKHDLSFVIGLTKTDRLKKHEIDTKRNEIIMRAETEYVFPLSAIKNTGVHEMEDFLYRNFIK